MVPLPSWLSTFTSPPWISTSSFTSAEPIKAAASPTNSVPVYSVRAVPFEAEPEPVAARAIVSAVSGDMHKANDVRRNLQAIIDLAAECHCAR